MIGAWIPKFAASRGLLYGLPILLLALVGTHVGAYHAGVERQVDRQARVELAAQRAYLTRLQRRIADNAALAAQYQEARNDADREYQQALAEIDRQRRRAEQLGRLRDPGRPGGCGPAVPAAAGPASGVTAGTTGSDLSAAATGFLLDLAADADRAAAYAQTCHAWVTRP